MREGESGFQYSDEQFFQFFALGFRDHACKFFYQIGRGIVGNRSASIGRSHYRIGALKQHDGAAYPRGYTRFLAATLRWRYLTLVTGVALFSVAIYATTLLPTGFLPEEDLVHFNVSREDLLAGRHTRAFKELMAFSVSRCRSMFLRGYPLIRRVEPGLSMELEATWRGGMAILQRVEDLDYEVLDFRPTLEKQDMLGIAARSIFSFGRRFLRGEV